MKSKKPYYQMKLDLIIFFRQTNVKILRGNSESKRYN